MFSLSTFICKLSLSKFRYIFRTYELSVLFIIMALSACGGGSDEGAGNSSSSSRKVAPQTTPQLEQAFKTGDASSLSDAKLIAQHAQYSIEKTSQEQAARVSSLYQGVSTEYDPTEWSYWIQPRNTYIAQPFIVGNSGKALASLSVVENGRSAAFGVNVLLKFNENSLVTYRPAFKRLIAWLVNGDAGSTLPKTLNVAFVGISSGTSVSGMAKAGVPATEVKCDFIENTVCASDVDLLVIGGSLAADAKLEPRIRALVASGRPVLYVHTKSNWASDSGKQILAAMDLKFGADGGNYWTKDKVSPGRTEALNSSLSDQFESVRRIVNTIASDRIILPSDWAACKVFAGKYDCSDVPGLESDFLTPVESLQSQVNYFNRTGQNIFDVPNIDLLRYLVLWADVYRNEITYPMDKVKSPAALSKALIADSLVAYVRKSGFAQRDLGTFAGEQTKQISVIENDEILDVVVPSSKGFTAIGRLAAPGKIVSITLLNAESAKIGLKVNTQDSGSTRIWDPDKYKRPKFLSSPEFSLQENQMLQFVSPYGGTLQLVFSDAEPEQTVRLRIRGVAKHPFLDETNGAADNAAFIAALNSPLHDWAEIKLRGIEIHSRSDLMKAVINNSLYGGDVNKYLEELKDLLFEGTYLLAGFALPGKVPTPHVLAMCRTLGWDCVDSTIHRSPSTQHINADKSAACGTSCSGNPFDISAGVHPRGGGESHEIGHNLQKNILNVYGDRSTEVSNNFFTKHKDWRIFREKPNQRETATKSYRYAFDILVAAKSDADKIEGAYTRLWSEDGYSAKSGERMVFYMQWIHYWADRQQSEATGWDIVTLLYMHQRQFAAVSTDDWISRRDALGYSTYATKPNPNGNDNLLIALSHITGRDQRPTFDLWGIRYSAEASAQVASFGTRAEPGLFYASTINNTFGALRKIDMTVANPVWPF